jgi:hypothetical protein
VLFNNNEFVKNDKIKYNLYMKKIRFIEVVILDMMNLKIERTKNDTRIE